MHGAVAIKRPAMPLDTGRSLPAGIPPKNRIVKIPLASEKNDGHFIPNWL
jgi:hypothetical protein